MSMLDICILNPGSVIVLEYCFPFLFAKKAWQDHKRECKCLKSCKPRYPPDSVRLLGRVVFKLMQETPSESEKLYSFYDLESNINKLTEDKKEGLRQLALTFQHFMKEEIQDASQLPPSFDIFEAFAKFCGGGFSNGNSFEVEKLLESFS
ncbi:hypothetical protein FD755_011808 [Muntiacus reevesi]|uniref:Uncharacterized protein n=2 Tax=Muntiacus TaxID=9885 RepID=A0A5N3XXJ6_MUNRE|nr:hypothetical protein FD755_011808 [Muntiacus reevesi]